MNAKEMRQLLKTLTVETNSNSKSDHSSSSKHQTAPTPPPKQPPSKPRPKEENAAAALSEQLKIQGNNYFKAGSYEDAIHFYTESLDAQPSSAVYANRAMAYLKLKNYSQAEKDCTLCLKIDPTYVKAYLRRGTARKETNNLKGAIHDFEMALRYEPLNKDAEAEMKPCIYAWMKENNAKLPQAETIDNITFSNMADGKKYSVAKGSSGLYNNNMFDGESDDFLIEESKKSSSSNSSSTQKQTGASASSSSSSTQKSTTTTKTKKPPSSSKTTTKESESQQFLRTWNSHNGDLFEQSKCLSAIQPEQLPTILEGILTPTLVEEILHVLLVFFPANAKVIMEVFKTSGGVDELVRYLNILPNTPGIQSAIGSLPFPNRCRILELLDSLWSYYQ